MPNNFRIDGTLYVSKSGHDSNDGLTKDTPKKSVLQQTGVQVIGSGVYDFLFNPGGSTITLKGDGKTIINSDITSGTNQAIAELYGITLYGAYGNRLNRTYKADNCSFIGGGAPLQTGGINTYCIFINFADSLVQNQGVLGGQKYDKCLFFDTTIRPANHTSTSTVINCYFDRLSFIKYANIINTLGIPRYSNINGVIQIGNFKYAIKDQLIGTPQDNEYSADVFWLTEANLTANGYTGTIAGWDAAVATCINRDPRFNDASKMDFTLKADSPHIGRASDGVSNIGGTSYAQSFYAGGSNPNILLLQPSAEIDTTSNMTDWKLKPGEVEGTIRAIVKVANTDEVITKLPYIGNFAFNSDDTPGTPTNFNVSDSKPSTNNYPDFVLTTDAASDTLRVVIADHGYNEGIWLKVDGQYREVTSVTQNELIFTTAVRAIVGAGVSVQVGTESELASLNPNRLNVLMRSSKSIDVNSGNWDNARTWDNDGLAPSGQYLAQEWGSQPLIDNLNQVGFGDDNFDTNYGNPIQLKVVDLLIFLRNNYRS